MPRAKSSRERARLLELLKKIRADAGITQVEMAKRLGQPQSFVSKYESGERGLDVLELLYVCKAAGISIGQFLQHLEEDEK